MRNRIAAMAVVAGILAAGCWPSGALVEATGSGSFTCPSFHACLAFLVIRPAGWTQRGKWTPGTADAQFPATSNDQRTWTVAGKATGGTASLAPGNYRLMLAYSEVDDTRPFALGTDDKPGSGLVTTTMACESSASVTKDSTTLEIKAVFGPECAIEAVAKP